MPQGVFDYPVLYGTNVPGEGNGGGTLVNLVQNSDIVTGTTAGVFLSAYPGDHFFRGGLVFCIVELFNDGGLTARLSEPWPLASVNNAPYLCLRWLQHTDERNIGYRVAAYFQTAAEGPQSVEAARALAEAFATNDYGVAVAGRPAGTYSARHYSIYGQRHASHPVDTAIPDSGGLFSSLHWSTKAAGHATSGAGHAGAAAGSATLSGQWAAHGEDVAIPGQPAGSFSSYHWSRKSLGHSTASGLARDLAQEWADNAEDDAITGNPGKFSSRHWSEKASDHSGLAMEWATNPQGDEITGAPGFFSAFHWSAVAGGYAVTTAGHVTQTAAARDLAQEWASKAPGEEITGVVGGRSSRHYSSQAAGSAVEAANSAAAAANLLLQAQTHADYGLITDVPTDTADYGTIT